jgi:hypothetical protein
MRWFAFERRWLRAVFDALLPSDAHPRVTQGARDQPLDRFVDDLLASSPRRFLLGLRVSLWMVALAPLVVLRRPRTFAGLGPDERLAVLERIRVHRVYLIRETINLLKMVACLGWGAMPAVRAQIGLERADAAPPAWALAPSAVEEQPRADATGGVP